MVMEFEGCAYTADGDLMLSRPGALLYIVFDPVEETDGVRYLRELIETLFAAFLMGKFRERSVEILEGEEDEPNKIRIRIFEAWLDGKLHLIDPSDSDWLPTRPPTSKADVARWKLAQKHDINAARKVWGLIDQLGPSNALR